MMSCGRAIRALAIASLLATGCRHHIEPNWGGLEPVERPFEFEHDIERFDVTNGLQVAVIPDTRTNLATVDVRYAVGAAEDPPGRRGMAHLAEHLLFALRDQQGGPTVGDQLGELTLYDNAYTTWDETHYTSIAPADKLGALLAIESRRMQARCEQIDEATFARERDVVLSENAQRGSPTADGWLRVLAEVYGAGHPYAHQVSTDEIKDATRDEVCQFIRSYYTPERACMVITGPVDAAAVQAAVGRLFGTIAARPAPPRAAIAAARLDGRTTHHQVAVSRPTAVVFLPYPAWGQDGVIAYGLGRRRLAAQLASAAGERDWITGTDVMVSGGKRARTMAVVVEVSSTDHLDEAVDLVFEQGSRLFQRDSFVTLHRELDGMMLDYVKSWERTLSRGDWVASFLQYTDDNRFMLREMAIAARLDQKRLREKLPAIFDRAHAHVALLEPDASADDAIALEAAVPTGSHALVPWRAPVDPADADRTIETHPTPISDRLERFELANGLRVELAPDPRSALVDIRLVFPVGRAHEGRDQHLVATAAALLLDHDLDGTMWADTGKKLYFAVGRGTDVTAGVDETTTTFRSVGRAQWGDWHLWRLSWLLDQGHYDKELVERVREVGAQLDDDDDDSSASDIDRRSFLIALFGVGHPYSVPAPDPSEAFEHLRGSVLAEWKRDHYRARGATLIVSGGFDAGLFRGLIERLYGPWSGDEPAALPVVPPTRPVNGPTWLAAYDDAPQTTVRIAFPIRSGSDDDPARAVVSEMLEDLARDVREGMGASYGVHTAVIGGAAGRALVLYGRVDNAHSGEAAARLLGAVEAVRDGGPVARAAFVRARRRVLAQTMARSGGASDVAALLEQLAAAGESPDAVERWARAIGELGLDDVVRVAAADLDPEHLVVQIAGGHAAVDEALRVARAGAVRPRLAAFETVDREPFTVDAPDIPVLRTDRPAREQLDTGLELWVGSPGNLHGPRRDGLFQGEREIGLDEFLRLSGHPEVVRRMSQRRWLRRGLVVGGLAGVAGAVTWVLVQPDCNARGSVQEQEQCRSEVSSVKARAGAIALTAALTAAVASQLSSLRPSNRTLREYAAAHNGQLRARARTADTWSTRLQVAPELRPGGGVLMVSGRF